MSMKFSRRNLLQGSSALAIVAAIPSFAEEARAGMNHGIAIPTTGFNGGVTQTNTNCAQFAGQYIFANMVKMSQGISYTSPPSAGSPGIPIIELDSNGYPTTEVSGTGGYNTIVQIPNALQYSGTGVCKWDGFGTIHVGAPGLSVSGTSSLGVPGRFTFTNPDTTATGTRLTWSVSAFSNTPNHVQNLRICRLADEAGVDNGTIVFFADNLAMMRSAKPGCIRSLNWGGGFSGVNFSTQGLWAQRRPTGYITYQGDAFLNASWWGGTTTNSGTDYSLAFSGFALTDKVIAQFIFNTKVYDYSSGGLVTISWSTTNTVAININFPSHPFVSGNTIVFGLFTGAKIPPSALLSGQIYYIATVVDANNFTVSATPGGSAVTATATTSGTMEATPVTRLSINGTAFVPMTTSAYPTPESIILGFSGPAPGNAFANLSTVTYDEITGWYVLSGPGSGLTNGSPPELFIDYCAAIGSHPWLVSPYLTQSAAAGGCTDYMPTWAAYATNKYSWMKPVIEPCNEVFGSGLGTNYAQGLAQILWGTPGTEFFDFANQAYGKWVSDIGQALSAQYGNDRTKYSMVCSIQTDTANVAASTNVFDHRLTSAAYVSAGGQPAYKFCDRVCGANYYSPTERFTVNEITDGWNYVVTNGGGTIPSTTGQLTIANGYAATADDGTNHSYTLTYILNCFTNLKAWGTGVNPGTTVPTAAGGNTVKGLVSYEGGWSPDFITAGWTTSVSSAAGSITQANPCVVTLNTTNGTGNSETGSLAGNPAAIGMAVSFASVGGMTQLNNAAITCTFPSSPSVNISAVNSLLVNQAITFPSNSQLGTPPVSNWAASGLTSDTSYYVVAATGTTFQVSASRGGSPITVSGNFSHSAQPGWFITAVGTSTITLDVDSSAFTAWTSGGVASWMNSLVYSNVLRQAGGNSPTNGTINTKWYGEYAGLASAGFVAEFPSNYLYFGPDQVWEVLPSIYDPLTPQWNSIVAAN